MVRPLDCLSADPVKQKMVTLVKLRSSQLTLKTSQLSSPEMCVRSSVIQIQARVNLKYRMNSLRDSEAVSEALGFKRNNIRINIIATNHKHCNETYTILNNWKSGKVVGRRSFVVGYAALEHILMQLTTSYVWTHFLWEDKTWLY